MKRQSTRFVHLTPLLLLTLFVGIFLAFSAPVRSDGTQARPLKRIWFHEMEASRLTLRIDNGSIFVPAANGSLVALSAATGEMLWSSEVLGEFTTAPVLCDGAIFVAARRAGDNDSSSSGVLRVVDERTGLILRSYEYPRTLTSLTVDEKVIYAGADDGQIYAIVAAIGQLSWKAHTGGAVRAPGLVNGGRLYIGSDDGYLYALNIADGSVAWKCLAEGKVQSSVASDAKRLYFGSSIGYVYAVSQTTGKIEWRLRTGASVMATPVITDDYVLVGSYDNFLYCLRRSNGAAVWRERVMNRLVTAPIVAGDQVLVTPFRSRNVLVYDRKTGDLMNQIVLLEDVGETVSGVVESKDAFILVTDRGVLALMRLATTASQK